MTDEIPSLPEDVQLVLTVGDGILHQGWTELAAAALVELTLLGRLGSLPETGLFARKEVRKLVVIDETPTGVRVLDLALQRLVARGKPWAPYSCLSKIAAPIAREVQETLICRGVIRYTGRPNGLKTRLAVVDEQQCQAAMRRLDSAWLKPDAVTSPRNGAFVDLLRNAGARFNRGAEQESIIRWQWYPTEIRDTVQAILYTERILSTPPSAAG